MAGQVPEDQEAAGGVSEKVCSSVFDGVDVVKPVEGMAEDGCGLLHGGEVVGEGALVPEGSWRVGWCSSHVGDDCEERNARDLAMFAYTVACAIKFRIFGCH